jgi:hypothetical protein
MVKSLGSWKTEKDWKDTIKMDLRKVRFEDGWWMETLGVKRPGREADHSLPSSTEVKNAWSYTSNPHTSP